MTEVPDRHELLALLGGWDIAFAEPERRGTRRIGGAVVDDLAFRSSEGDLVAGWWARPEGATGTRSTILYCHAHGGRRDIGRDELTDSRPQMQGAYLQEFAPRGWNVLCLEMATFGSRAEPNESALSKARLWQGRTLFGQMIAELRAGIGWLVRQPQVDPSRLAAVGLSMGGMQALWLAALDDRVRVSVCMAAYADLASMVETGHHDGHGHYMTVPGFLALTSTGRLAGLSAPKPQLICNGLSDHLAPEPAYRKARAETEAAYAAAGAAAALEFHVEPDAGHEEPPATRAAVLSFLDRRLA